MERKWLPPQLKSNCKLWLTGDYANVTNPLSGNSLYDDASLVRYYSMNDLTEKNGNDLVAYNSPSQVSGRFGGAYSSTGSAYLVDDTSNWITNGAMTIAWWVKVGWTHARSDHPWAVSTWDDSTDVMYAFWFNQNSTALVFSRLRQLIVWEDTSYSFTPVLGTWYHVAMTYNAGSVNGYLNGVLVATGSAGWNGSWTTGTWVTLMSGFNWAVDDVSVFNRALSLNEIASIYGQQLAFDASGNGNNWTLVGSPTPKRRVWYKGWSFNGSSQSVSFPNITGLRSFSATINPTANNKTILTIASGVTVSLSSSNTIVTAWLTWVSVRVDGRSVNSIQLNKFQTVTVTFDSVNSVSGNIASSSFAGIIANPWLYDVVIPTDVGKNLANNLFIPT